MRYNYVKEAIENGDYDNYTDRVDVSIEISLFEYGILRDPKTNNCILLRDKTNNWEMEENNKSIHLISNEVTLSDVKDYLKEDADDRFFSYIGSDLETELKRLDNDNLAHIINSINQWDGWFID